MKSKHLALILAGLIFQGQSIASKPLALESNAFGYMKHPFYVIDNRILTYNTDPNGHVPVNTRFNRPSAEHFSLIFYSPQMVPSHKLLFPVHKPVSPYEVVQKITPDINHIESRNSSGWIHTAQHGLNMVFVEKCGIYLLGQNAYKGCIAR